MSNNNININNIMTEEKNCLLLKYTEHYFHIEKCYALNEIETEKFNLSQIKDIDVTNDAPDDFNDDSFYSRTVIAKLYFIEPITKTFYNEIIRLDLVDHVYDLYPNYDGDRC